MRLNPAFVHFALDYAGRNTYCNRNGFSLADFVFQDPQCLVERGDEKIDYAVADGLSLGCNVGCSGKGGTPSYISCDRQSAPVGIKFAHIDQRSAKVRLSTGINCSRNRCTPRQSEVETVSFQLRRVGSYRGWVERQWAFSPRANRTAQLSASPPRAPSSSSRAQTG